MLDTHACIAANHLAVTMDSYIILTFQECTRKCLHAYMFKKQSISHAVSLRLNALL